MRARKGLGKNIHVKLSDKEYDPEGKDGNASTVSLPDVGTALQNILPMSSSQAGLASYDRDVPFQLLTGALPDNSSLLTLPGDSWTNDSVLAS